MTLNYMQMRGLDDGDETPSSCAHAQRIHHVQVRALQRPRRLYQPYTAAGEQRPTTQNTYDRWLAPSQECAWWGHLVCEPLPHVTVPLGDVGSAHATSSSEAAPNQYLCVGMTVL